MLRYHHRQFGTVAVVIGGLAVLLILALLLFVETHPVGIAVEILIVACLIIFSTLTVDISDTDILLYFGPGLVRKRFPLGSIIRAELARNRWYFGWGIRWLPHRWLFNVSGLDSVEIELQNGRIYRIGTDEPEKLLGTIRDACGLTG